MTMLASTRLLLKNELDIVSRWVHPTVSRLTNSLYSVADQALLSAINFSIGMYFVHFSTKDEYGLYALSYGIITLVISFAGALIMTPMTVSYADRPIEQRESYCASMLIGQYGIFLPAIALMLLVVGSLYQAGVMDLDTTRLATVIGIAAVGGMLWEFSRRYYYLRLQPGTVLRWDIYYASMMAIGLLTAMYFNLRSMHWWIFVIYGLAATGTGLWALSESELARPSGSRQVWESVRESWGHGRWTLGGVLVTWVQNQSFVYFLAVFADLASVADANAARLLVAPLMLVNSGLTNVLLPRLVLLRSEERYTEAEQLARRLMWVIAGIFVLYTALIVSAEERLTRLVLGDAYTGLESFIVAWAVVNLLTALRGNTSILLQVFKAFRTITLANISSAIVVVVLTWPLMYYFGVLGSIAAVALGEIILVVLLRSGFAHIRRTYAS